MADNGALYASHEQPGAGPTKLHTVEKNDGNLLSPTPSRDPDLIRGGATATLGTLKDTTRDMSGPNHPLNSQQHKYKFEDASWNLDSVERYWPCRLLHIPSMTSIERTNQDTYNGVCKPRYGILTYTWGRWKRREADGPKLALGVQGTPWDIPSVKEEHFTVEAFNKVVQRIGQEVDWAWIDVACIEQRDGDSKTKADKMYEIGRQVGIFANAHQVFVWLSHLDTSTLTENLENIRHHGNKLSMLKERTSQQLEIHLSNLKTSLSAVLTDPWFSSLWTLQEMILRKDALIFSREADTVHLRYAINDPGDEVFLPILATKCFHIYQELERMESKEQKSKYWTEVCSLVFSNPHLKALRSEIMTDIRKAGFTFLRGSNPNVQYGLAQFRQTRRPLDRIYGIMQIYNVRVGETIRPQETPTLDQLEDEFATAICKRCPILGQLFVHLEQPRRGKAWRISQHSFVPNQILNYKGPNPKCTIDLPPGATHARFKGSKCSLTTLSVLWVEFVDDALGTPPDDEDRQDYLRGQASLKTQLALILDAHTIEDPKVLNGPGVGSAEPPTHLATEPKPGCKIVHSREVVELCQKYGEDKLDVLELGTLKTGTSYFDKTTEELTAAPERYGIVTRRQNLKGEEVVYKRIGLCLWRPFWAFAGREKSLDRRLGWEECEIALG